MTSIFLAPGAAHSDSIPAAPAGVVLKTLPNGLVIIVREDHSAPVVSVQAWCKSGSIDEGRWLGAGLSHVLEHMLFKGTKTRPVGRIDQEVQEAGGYMNAYTSFDRTVYHIDAPETGAAVAIDILCDIMRNATLPAEELLKEKQVILREMDMNQDDPGRRSGRRLFETAFTRSPYRYTIIGYPDIYNEITREDVADYYHSRYAPNNSFFVVVGDVSAESVIRQIEGLYADAKLRVLPLAAFPEEPRQTAPREEIEEAPIELGHLHYSWHIPDIRHPDLPAVDVLGVILGGGRSSRLFQQVRERLGLAHSVDAWVYSPGQVGLFGLSAVVDPGKLRDATGAMLAEVEKLRDLAPSDAEVTKARNQFVAGTLSSRKTMQGQAQDLGGSWLAAGDLNFSSRYLAAIRQVSPEEVRRVARLYLTEENRTFYALLPKGRIPAAPSQPAGPPAGEIRKLVLSNGLRLLLKEDHRLPFVEFRLAFGGGLLAESVLDNGITQLTSKMLLKGTATRSAEQIASEIEALGGHISTFSGNNSFGLSVELMSPDAAKGVGMLADVLLHSSFPAGELEREREHQLAGIKAQRDRLLASAYAMMRRGLFGEGGYGLEALGTEETVSRLRREDLLVYLRTWAVPSNAVLAIFGDIQSEEIIEEVTAALAGWPVAAAPPLAESKIAPEEPLRLAETRDKKQAVVVVGFPGGSIRGPDRFALDLLQEACSDLGSRLFMRVRDELGLAYYVGAQHFCGLEPGTFSFHAGTSPENAARVESELLGQAALLATEGLSAAELSRAKAKMIGQRKISRQDLGSLAFSTVLDELYGLGYDFFTQETALIEAVSLEQVRAAAASRFRNERQVVVVLQPEPGAEPPRDDAAQPLEQTAETCDSPA